MEDMYASPVQVEDRVFIERRGREGKKIRINNPDHDRPVILFLGIITILSIFSLINLDINWAKLASRLGNLAGTFEELAKFNFKSFNDILTAFAESVAVTALATLYSLIVGLFAAAFMARNITPSKKLAAVLSAFFSFIRAVPTPVWVLISLACLGFGPAPGIVGLSLHATAFFARAFAQSYEEVSMGSIEALQATGANRIQIFFSAVLPASFTSLIAWGAMRFEINFSESAILGMVGGGGIGYSIAANMSGYNLGGAGIAIFMVFVFAYSLELTFTAIKRRMK